MGVYIKGMKMPKSCAGCRFYGAYCYAKGDENTYSTLPCPLVSVPPHGDLIDREWLVDIGLHLMNIAKNDDIANGVKWLWQYVIEAPTIIEAEEEN